MTLLELEKLHEKGVAYGKLSLNADQTAIESIETNQTESIKPPTLSEETAKLTILTPEDDMWRMGTLLYQLNMAKSPELDLQKIKTGIIDSNKQRDKSSELQAEHFSDFIIQMIDISPSDRITAQEALWHPFLSNYVYQNEIGGGVFATVFKVTLNGHPMAIKRNRTEDNLYEFKSLKHEAKIIRQLNTQAKVSGVCVPIIQHFSQYKFKGHFHLVLGFCEGKTLKDQKISLERIQNIGAQILRALSFMEKNGVIHADLKTYNLILDDLDKITLIDFGIAQRVGEVLTQKELQARIYRSPEALLQFANYSPAMDMWSLGCIFFEMFTGGFLFPYEMEGKQYKDIKLLGPYPELLVAKGTYATCVHNLKCTSARQNTTLKERITKTKQASNSDEKLLNMFIDLLEKIMVYEPGNRLTPDLALKHVFFREIK